MTKLIAIACFGLAAWGQSITMPGLGFVRDPQGSLRAVSGIAGNFLLSDTSTDGVDSAAFSGSSGFLKTGSRLDVLDRQGDVVFSVDVPIGPVLFAFSSRGGPALVFHPASATLLRWTGTALEPTPVQIDGTVLAIADPATFVIQRDDGVWLNSDTLLPPEVQPPLFLSPTGDLVFSEPGGIVIRREASPDVHLPTPFPPASLVPFADGWLYASGPDRMLAIRITSTREQVYELPAACGAGC